MFSFKMLKKKKNYILHSINEDFGRFGIGGSVGGAMFTSLVREWDFISYIV